MPLIKNLSNNVTVVTFKGTRRFCLKSVKKSRNYKLEGKCKKIQF